MRTYLMFPASLLVALFSAFATSQVSQPEVTLHNWDKLENIETGDGQRMRFASAGGEFVAIARSEMPAGANWEQHNHAYELILLILEGRMKLTSGDREMVMHARDLAVIPSFVPHGYEVLEDTVMIEAASPGHALTGLDFPTAE